MFGVPPTCLLLLGMQSSPIKEKKKKKVKDEAKSLGLIQKTQDFLLEPSSAPAKLDTSQWPLLLKVKFAVRCTVLVLIVRFNRILIG